MTTTRMNEAKINASLDAYLHLAQEGDTKQAKRLHNMLESMLIEREIPDGKLWLTNHGKRLLADMHHELGHCEGSGERLRDSVLDAVKLKPHIGHWDDTCTYLTDLRIGIAVAHELCEQRKSGTEQDISLAVQAVADSGEFGLEPAQIRAAYDEIATTVIGFKEIPANC